MLVLKRNFKHLHSLKSVQAWQPLIMLVNRPNHLSSVKTKQSKPRTLNSSWTECLRHLTLRSVQQQLTVVLNKHNPTLVLVKHSKMLQPFKPLCHHCHSWILMLSLLIQAHSQLLYRLRSIRNQCSSLMTIDNLCLMSLLLVSQRIPSKMSST